MKPQEQPATSAGQMSDRRRHSRRTSEAQVRIAVEACQIDGVVDNLSRSGLLCFCEGDLRVSVQLQENGGTVTRKGRLVRAQRMRGESSGWAIEFD